LYVLSKHTHTHTHTLYPFKTKRLNNVHKFNFYVKEDTVRIPYKDQSVLLFVEKPHGKSRRLSTESEFIFLCYDICYQYGLNN